MLQFLYRGINKHYIQQLNDATIKTYCPEIYADEAPPGTSYPLITFKDVSGEVPTRTYCKNIEAYIIEFSVYSKKAEEVDFLGGLLNDIYNNYKISLEVGEVISVKRKSQQIEYDSTDNIFIYTPRYEYLVCDNL